MHFSWQDHEGTTVEILTNFPSMGSQECRDATHTMGNNEIMGKMDYKWIIFGSLICALNDHQDAMDRFWILKG